MNLYSVLLQAPAGLGSINLIFFAVIGIVFWFLIFKPQRDQQKKLETFRQSLTTGDEVITNGGIYGRVIRIKDDKVVIEVAKNVEITVARFSVNPVAENKDKDIKK